MSNTVRIWHENLAVLGEDERLPLSSLQPDSHIHGGLRVQFGERMAPYLGFFGPDDVCFGQWLEELWLTAQAFQTSKEARHTFDEGEQGQPAFVFERAGEAAFFSIAASDFSEAEGDMDWQHIEFSPEEFLEQHSRFRESFFAAIRASAPTVAEHWIQRHDPANRKS